MTAQVPDILLHRGERYDLCEAPLRGYLNRLPKHRRPVFEAPSTACWRGHVATWEIAQGRLWLVDLEGFLKRGGDVVPCGLREALPWLNGPLEARWVTGELRCPEGALTCYVHAGFASGYERDRLFHVERGRIVAEWLRINPPDPVWYAIAADGGRIRHEDGDTRSEVLPDLCAPGEIPDGARYWGEGYCRKQSEPGHVLGGWLTLPGSFGSS